MRGGDESEPSILFPPSSATEPLLLSGDPSAPTPPAASSAGEEAYPPISYLHGRRPVRDLPALILFLLLSLSTVALGLLAVIRRNPARPRAASFAFDPVTASCVPANSLSLSLSSSSSSPFLKDLISSLVATLLLAGPIALSLLWLLRHFAKQVVYAAIPFFVLTPAALNVFWFAACSLSRDCRRAFPLAYRVLVLAFVFILVAIVLWIIVANWHRIELTVRIVRIAAAALAGNLGLLAVLPALGIALVAYFAPVVVFLVFATWNGDVVPRWREAAGGGGGYHVCVWRQDRWVPAYFALAIVTMVWSAATMVEAQVYVISGTIAQWYFAKEGAKPRKSIRSSLRYDMI